MNIDLVWYFSKAHWVYPLYRDGVRAAMEEIARRGHTVRWHLGLDPQIPTDSDFILLWDSSGSQFIKRLKDYPQRKGIILTTDLGMDVEALRPFDIVFAEAQPVVDKIRPYGIRVVKAFGTDTDFFRPTYEEKLYKAFYPATFSPWKRQNLFADKYGRDGLCVGTVQPDGWGIYEHCIRQGTHVITGYLPAKLLKALYNMSEFVDITGWEGSGRTVLEAMSLGKDVLVSPENHKCQSYIDEYTRSGLEPRDFVLKNYSEKTYADAILKGAQHD